MSFQFNFKMSKQDWFVVYFATFFSHSIIAAGQQHMMFSGKPFDPVKGGIAVSVQSRFGCPLVINRALEPSIQDHGSTGLFSFDGHSADRTERYLMSIRRSEGCVTGLAFGSNPLEFALVADLTERILNSKLVVMGSSKALISTIKRQVMVLVVDPIARIVKVNIYCGRRTGAYWVNNVNFWTPDGGFKQDLVWDQYCRHILQGQKFIVGHTGISPMVVMPNKPGDEIRGVEVNAVKVLAEKYNLDLHYTYGEMEGVGVDLTKSTGVLGNLTQDKIDMAINVILHTKGYTLFECTTYVHTLELKYCTRRPKKLVDFGNLGRGFDFWSWISIFVCLSLFSITFAVIFYVYKANIGHKHLYKDPGNPVDFFLLTFTAIVEPDPLVWFPSWSSGRMLFLLWSVFAFFMTGFFNSNLRSNLIAPSLEPTIETMEDFLSSGRELFVLDMLGFLLLQKSGTSFQRFLDYVDDNPSSIYSLNDDLDAMTEKIMGQGAVTICPKENEMISYLTDPVNNGLPNRYFSKESLFTGFTANRFRRYSPYVPHMNALIERYVASGLNQKALYEKLPLVALPGRLKSNQNKNEIRMSLSMMWMALFILAGGIILGMVAFAIEISMDRNERCKS